MRACIAVGLLSLAACADETPPADTYVHALGACPGATVISDDLQWGWVRP